MRLTQEQKDCLIKDFESGIGIDSLSIKYSISEISVRYNIKNAGTRYGTQQKELHNSSVTSFYDTLIDQNRKLDPENQKWNNNKSKVWIRCNRCNNVVKQQVVSVSRGKRGCRFCSGKDTSQAINRFLELLKSQNRTPLEEIGSLTKPLKVMCGVCGETRTIVPKNVLYDKNKCSVCSGTDSFTSYSRLIKKLEEQKRIIVGEWNGSENKITAKCLVCGLESAHFPGNITTHNVGCPHCSPKSKMQTELFEFVRQFIVGMDVLYNDRTAIRPMELDIYVPSLKKAIEFDGSFWHKSEWAIEHGAKERDARKDKECQEAGIDLLRISEEMYDVNPDQVRAIVKSFLTTPTPSL